MPRPHAPSPLSRVVRLVAGGALLVALLGASLVPCMPAGGGTKSTAAHAHTAHAGGGAEHPPGCPQANRPTLAPPCPCGCRERAPASPSARLGPALLGFAPALEIALVRVLPERSRPSAPEGALRAVDHVPRLG